MRTVSGYIKEVWTSPIKDALGAFGDAGAYTNQGGVLTVFALDNGGM